MYDNPNLPYRCPICLQSVSPCTEGAGYYDDDDGWRDDFGRLLGVIAWCEPKFEE